MQGFVDGAGEVKKALASKLGVPEDAPTITKLEWLGLFKDSPIGLAEGGNIDILAKRMLEKCQYAEGERDMLVMQHEFEIEYPDRTERAFSTMVDFGIPGGDSSMARTVSLPVAIATRMILEGKITQQGIVAPVMPDVYSPILDELESLGIRCEERTA
jgi:saccharopine dehydrogenase (NADP+, L-glutamate forming)/spermidine synthase